MFYSKRRIEEYGIRNCPACNRFLPKFNSGECTCSHCGVTYSSAFDSSY